MHAHVNTYHMRFFLAHQAIRATKRFARLHPHAYNDTRMKYCIAIALLLCSCESVRTVYDEYGNEVKEREPGKETDLMARFEERIDASFKRQKNDQGVMQAVSSRVSSYQKALDEARGTEERYATTKFAGVTKDESFSKRYDASKQYTGIKSYKEVKESSYSTDQTPDFLNKYAGIAHESYKEETKRFSSESERVVGMEKQYSTQASRYTRDTQSGYIESRRDNTPPPDIYNYKDYYNKEVFNTRAILGRDQSDQKQ